MSKPTKKEQRMKDRDLRNKRINEQMGFGDRTERLQHDRYSNGTGGKRQRPRTHNGFTDGFKPMERGAEQTFIQLIEAINPEAGREGDYPQDANTPQQYHEGDECTIKLLGRQWRVRIVKVAAMFDRWRVKVDFLDTDASFTVTQAQLAHIEIKPVVLMDHRPLMQRYGIGVPRWGYQFALLTPWGYELAGGLYT